MKTVPVEKIEEGVSKVEGQEPDKVEAVEVSGEETPKKEAPEPTPSPLEARLDKLERENAVLKDRLESRQEQPQVQTPKITASQLRSLSEEARESVEKSTGLPFNEVLSRVEANEESQRRSESVARDAKLNAREAIDDAIEADPKLGKVKTYLKEFLADFSDEDKANPNRLKKLMEKAVIYAKGKGGIVASSQTPSKARQDTPSPRPDGNFVDENSGDIRPGKYRIGDMTISIDDNVPKDIREKIKHPEDPNGIRIPMDFDKEPEFKR